MAAVVIRALLRNLRRLTVAVVVIRTFPAKKYTVLWFTAPLERPISYPWNLKGDEGGSEPVHPEPPTSRHSSMDENSVIKEIQRWLPRQRYF